MGVAWSIWSTGVGIGWSAGVGIGYCWSAVSLAVWSPDMGGGWFAVGWNVDFEM